MLGFYIIHMLGFIIIQKHICILILKLDMNVLLLMYTYCHLYFFSLKLYVYFLVLQKKKLVYRGFLKYVANAHWFLVFNEKCTPQVLGANMNSLDISVFNASSLIGPHKQCPFSYTEIFLNTKKDTQVITLCSHLLHASCFRLCSLHHVHLCVNDFLTF